MNESFVPAMSKSKIVLTSMTPLEHRQTSHRFIQQAVTEHADDDLLQASEKTWGAAAHAVKAIAERRGWSHDSHRLLFVAVDRMLSETDRYEIRRLFRVASDSHKNFYEGWMSDRRVARNIEHVEKLLEILEGIR